MYGKPCERSVNVVRSKLLKDMVGEDDTLSSKSKVDMVCLPRSMSGLSRTTYSTSQASCKNEMNRALGHLCAHIG